MNMKFLSFTAALIAVAVVSSPTTASSEDVVEPGAFPLIAAVGDIACAPAASTTLTQCRDQFVAPLVPAETTAFLPLGDEQYENGSLENFVAAYDSVWGGLLPITKPTPGNHEYITEGATGYYTYFNQPPAWYSFDLGNWHLVSLNSNCRKIGGCGPTKPQGVWLKADLAASTAPCTLAYWHHPRYNSGEHSGVKNMTWAWNMLTADRAEVVLNGHEHAYQRFQPINGITEFVVGSGGKSHYAGGATNPLSALRNITDYGVLTAELSDTSFNYQWVIEDGTILDSGSIACTP